MGQASAVADLPVAGSAAVAAEDSEEPGNAILLNGVSLPANRELGVPGIRIPGRHSEEFKFSNVCRYNCHSKLKRSLNKEIVCAINRA